MPERAHGRPLPDTTQTLTGEDWYGEDLTGRTADHVAFLDLDLGESTSTSGLEFDECLFRGAQFHQAAHTGAAFANCTFIDCQFFGASFLECKFVGSSFLRCTFERMTVRGGDWSFVALPGADLKTASFEDLRMREADLTGARLTRSVLRNTDLTSASLDKADFTNCDLRGSNLTALDPFTVRLGGAIIDWQQALVITHTMGLDVRPD